MLDLTKAVVLNLKHASESLESLVKHKSLGPPPTLELLIPLGLGWGPEHLHF